MNSGGRIDSVAVCNHELVTVPEDDSVLSGLIADLQVGAGHQDQLLHLRLIHSHLVRDTVPVLYCIKACAVCGREQESRKYLQEQDNISEHE